MCVAMHGLFFIIEVLMYNWIISMWFTEIVLAWLAYNAYMRMVDAIIYCYTVLLTITGVLGIFSIFAVGGWFIIYVA